MRFGILILLFILPASASVRAADAVVVEPIEPAKSEAIEWTKRSHESIDGKVFTAPVSILLTKCSDIVISACDLHSIQLVQCQRITIGNCWIHDAEACGVQTYDAQEILVQGCRLENISSGVYAMESRAIQVVGNYCHNVRGPFPRGQMVQLCKCTGTGTVIRDNYAVNERGQSWPEDCISVFQSTGTADSPILIENNYLAGDPIHGSADKSKTGSGIMLGDLGGSYELCEGNVIVSAGAVGIGVAGGSHITVRNNVIWGANSNISNQGLCAVNQSKGPCGDVSITGNRVRWVTPTEEDASWWAGPGVDGLQLKSNQFADPTLPATLPAPPSHAPTPPRPWVAINAKLAPVARVPWKP